MTVLSTLGNKSERMCEDGGCRHYRKGRNREADNKLGNVRTTPLTHQICLCLKILNSRIFLQNILWWCEHLNCDVRGFAPDIPKPRTTTATAGWFAESTSRTRSKWCTCQPKFFCTCIVYVYSNIIYECGRVGRPRVRQPCTKPIHNYIYIYITLLNFSRKG